jgi:hypothetical protein
MCFIPAHTVDERWMSRLQINARLAAALGL